MRMTKRWNLFEHPRTTWPTLPAAIIFPGDQPAMPSQERCRRHNRGQVIKHTPAQFLGPDGQASALVVAKPQSLTSELLAEHTILFLKVVDDILLSLVYPARETKSRGAERDRMPDASCHRSTGGATKRAANQGRASPVTYSSFEA